MERIYNMACKRDDDREQSKRVRAQVKVGSVKYKALLTIVVCSVVLGGSPPPRFVSAVAPRPTASR